jgi:hypothetical protein
MSGIDHVSSNERVSDKRLAELVSHYENVDKQHNGWWVAVYWSLRELQERRSAHETTAHFQGRVHQWMKDCFKRPDALFLEQRAFRFIEEALELAQAAGTSREDVLRLVQYVYDRPVGVISQEIGGVMVTLAALATSCYYIMDECGETELSRCVKNTDRIRAKDLVKPQRSPLPGLSEEPSPELCMLTDGVIHCRCGHPSSHYGTMGARGAREVREVWVAIPTAPLTCDGACRYPDVGKFIHDPNCSMHGVKAAPKYVECDYCNGDGRLRFSGDMHACEKCSGTGRVEVNGSERT